MRSDAIDLSGKKFNRLFVLNYFGSLSGNSMWLCRCNCGNKRLVSSYNLRNSVVYSCGCYKAEKAKQFHTKHGHSIRNKHTSTYNSWDSMIQRCTNKKNMGYHNYGGRGIKVCERWLKFENFLVDMGEKPKDKIASLILRGNVLCGVKNAFFINCCVIVLPPCFISPPFRFVRKARAIALKSKPKW